MLHSRESYCSLLIGVLGLAAVELVVVRPDAEMREVLGQAGLA